MSIKLKAIVYHLSFNCNKDANRTQLVLVPRSRQDLPCLLTRGTDRRCFGRLRVRSKQQSSQHGQQTDADHTVNLRPCCPDRLGCHSPIPPSGSTHPELH